MPEIVLTQAGAFGVGKRHPETIAQPLRDGLWREPRFLGLEREQVCRRQQVARRQVGHKRGVYLGPHRHVAPGHPAAPLLGALHADHLGVEVDLRACQPVCLAQPQPGVNDQGKEQREGLIRPGIGRPCPRALAVRMLYACQRLADLRLFGQQQPAIAPLILIYVESTTAALLLCAAGPPPRWWGGCGLRSYWRRLLLRW